MPKSHSFFEQESRTFATTGHLQFLSTFKLQTIAANISL
jgi:hypothetical protein